VWVDFRSEIVINQGSVVGIQETWSLDDEFSVMILTDGDTDGNGKFSPAEVRAIKLAYFDNLTQFDYFTHLYQGAKALPTPKSVSEFEVVLLPSGRIQYQFFLPLKVSLTSGPLSVSFYDDTFYVDVEYAKTSPVTLRVLGGGRATLAFHPDKSKAFWGGEIIPVFAVVTWVP